MSGAINGADAAQKPGDCSADLRPAVGKLGKRESGKAGNGEAPIHFTGGRRARRGRNSTTDCTDLADGIGGFTTKHAKDTKEVLRDSKPERMSDAVFSVGKMVGGSPPRHRDTKEVLRAAKPERISIRVIRAIRG